MLVTDGEHAAAEFEAAEGAQIGIFGVLGFLVKSLLVIVVIESVL